MGAVQKITTMPAALRRAAGGDAPWDMTHDARPFLESLRGAAALARVKSHRDLFEACAVLSANKTAAKNAFADALLRCLPEATGRRPVFYAPGSAEVSFDEAWLLRLKAALSEGDTDSAEFLLRSRVQPFARQSCLFLIRGLSR